MYDSHEMMGKWIEVKAAMVSGTPAPGQKGSGKGPSETKKVFIGGIKGATEADVNTFCSQFGTVVQVDLKTDQETGKSRGFCFVSFDSEDAVANILNNASSNTINGQWVEVKMATNNAGGGGKSKGKGKAGGMGAMGGGMGAMGGGMSAWGGMGAMGGGMGAMGGAMGGGMGAMGGGMGLAGAMGGGMSPAAWGSPAVGGAAMGGAMGGAAMGGGWGAQRFAPY